MADRGDPGPPAVAQLHRRVAACRVARSNGVFSADPPLAAGRGLRAAALCRGRDSQFAGLARCSTLETRAARVGGRIGDMAGASVDLLSLVLTLRPLADASGANGVGGGAPA